MSEFSGVFDQLADALKDSGASPSTTLRQHRPERQGRRHGATLTQTFAARAVPMPETIPAKPPRQIDRSRDHAIYAAPHRPSRPQFVSRPDDVVTERVFRKAIETASNASRSLPIVTIAFTATVALGLAVFVFFSYR